MLKTRAVQFMDTPDSYYDQLGKRLEVFGIGRIDENPDDLRRLRILIDGNKEHSYLLQIFMKDAASLYGDREAGPFFYEVIQRKGDKGFGARQLPLAVREHRARPEGRGPGLGRRAMIERLVVRQPSPGSTTSSSGSRAARWPSRSASPRRDSTARTPSLTTSGRRTPSR